MKEERAEKEKAAKHVNSAAANTQSLKNPTPKLTPNTYYATVSEESVVYSFDPVASVPIVAAAYRLEQQ